MAEFRGQDEALTSRPACQVNLGTISSLITRDDVVILDKDDHASIVDGARLGYGTIERFRHNDIEHLDRVLQSLPGMSANYRGGWRFQHGRRPGGLPGIIPVAGKYGARIMVDDAHGMGVMGRGHGTAAEFGVTDQVDLIMSTFSNPSPHWRLCGWR